MGRGGCGGEDPQDQTDYDPAARGPATHRSCTDLICLALLLVFLVAWLAVAGLAFSRGNPAQLIHPR